MAAKYNYSIKRVRYGVGAGEETLQVVNCDSFDEAIRIVEKAVYDRELKEREDEKKGAVNPESIPVNVPSTTATVPISANSNSVPTNPENNDNNPQQGDQPVA